MSAASAAALAAATASCAAACASASRLFCGSNAQHSKMTNHDNQSSLLTNPAARSSLPEAPDTRSPRVHPRAAHQQRELRVSVGQRLLHTRHLPLEKRLAKRSGVMRARRRVPARNDGTGAGERHVFGASSGGRSPAAGE